VKIVHRCGYVAPGVPLVVVAATSLHRMGAIEDEDYIIFRLKAEAIFWKREDAVDGSRWIEPTLADEADRARWSK
jgi:molybdopterin synthase catalytic subunit